MSTQTVSKSYLIKWAIIIGLTLACFLIPEGGIITMNVKLFCYYRVWLSFGCV